MTTLLWIEKSTYTDQHGFVHDCWLVLEEVLVHPTGEYYEYDYYSETVKNPKYSSDDGRRWTAMIPTDYGGSTSWSRYEDGERVKNEKWIGEYQTYGLPPKHGLLPIIHRKEKP